jgi:hypothetical protein
MRYSKFSTIGKVPYLLLFMTLFFSNCQKGPETSPDDPNIPRVGSMQSFLIDTVNNRLLSTSDELLKGLFRYDKLQNIDSIRSGDFLVEPRNLGHLRIIEKVERLSNEVRLTTRQGTISEFYADSGDVTKVFAFSEKDNPFIRKPNNKDDILSDGKLRISAPEFSLNGNGYSFSVKDLLFEFDPTITAEFSIKQKRAKVGFQNVTTNWKLTTLTSIELNNRQISDTFRLSKVLPKFRNLLRLPFGSGFFYGHLAIEDFYLVVSAKGNSKLDHEYQYDEQNKTVAFAEYKNGILSSVYEKTNQKYKKEGKVNYLGDAGFSISIIPVFKIYFYSVPTAKIGVSPGLFLDWKFRQTSLLWNSQYYFGGEVFGEIDNTHFSFITGDLRIAKDLPKVLIYEAPKNIKVVSGQDQSAIRKQKLSQPIVFEVLDSEEKGQGPVKVFFSSNQGLWDKPNSLSVPLTGRVENRFTMGDTDVDHELKASIRDADDREIQSVTFTIKPLKSVDTVALLTSEKGWVTSDTSLGNYGEWNFGGSQSCSGRRYMERNDSTVVVYKKGGSVLTTEYLSTKCEGANAVTSLVYDNPLETWRFNGFLNRIKVGEYDNIEILSISETVLRIRLTYDNDPEIFIVKFDRRK